MVNDTNNNIRYFQDIDYKIDFLVEFIRLSHKRQKYYLSNLVNHIIATDINNELDYKNENAESIIRKKEQELIDFKIIFKLHGYDLAERHYQIVNTCFKNLHRIHSGELQQLIRSCFRNEKKLPHINIDPDCAHFIPKELTKYYQPIKFEYSALLYTNDALFSLMFAFFWNTANKIYHNYRRYTEGIKNMIAKREAEDKSSTVTKFLHIHIVEKILIGDFVTPEEIMIVRENFEVEEKFIRLRRILPIPVTTIDNAEKEASFDWEAHRQRSAKYC